jgi:hypothetical protein
MQDRHEQKGDGRTLGVGVVPQPETAGASDDPPVGTFAAVPPAGATDWDRLAEGADRARRGYCLVSPRTK